MNDTRSVIRFRLLMFVAFMIALALGSFWLLDVMRRNMTVSATAPPRSESDYYVEKFSYVRTSNTGLARYNISGAKLTHNPQDDSFAIQQPVIHSLGNDRPAMTMRAERALVDHDSSKVHMYNNVQLDRPASGKDEHFHLKSEYLLILPDDDVVKTDEAVEIIFGKSRLTGIGMFASNAARQFRLSDHVRGTYRAALQR